MVFGLFIFHLSKACRQSVCCLTKGIKFFYIRSPFCLRSFRVEEYQRIAEELSSKFPDIDIDQIIELLTIYGEVFETKDILVSVCEDPDDNKFIECAIAGNSKLIVSGDKHLLNITGYHGISVLKPRDFIENHLK